ncbi:formate dehydrogenase accessory protein FdhE [Calidifontibacillus oryziterrae]|uniref:formate dehydrogenase accessory protein FdhE n=1 Tax=Calidifontibacillus oryziterrae TaxID=1191699 RepID=UPI0002F9B91E|nr:formate dehydrogenase accessory protein FdhE [Calidifontibacillus oryziterrae]
MSVVTDEYLKIQKEIIKRQGEWQQQITATIPSTEKSYQNSLLPLFEQVNVKIDIELYKNWLSQLIDYLGTVQPTLKEQFDVVKGLLDEHLLNRWVDEVIRLNEFYFQNFAKENKIDEWIPHFLAEHTVRPYLRAVAQKYEQEISDLDAKGVCPCCGEPIRLAYLEGSVGRKVVHCPRCYAHWNEKRSKCSHCGKDNDDKMTYLHVEGDDSMRIHTCQHCNGYVKVIDIRQRLKKEEPAIVDLNTIHLDIIAQERGYGITKATVDEN